MFVNVGAVVSGAKCAPASLNVTATTPSAKLFCASLALLTLNANGTPAVTVPGSLNVNVAIPAALTAMFPVVALMAVCTA